MSTNELEHFVAPSARATRSSGHPEMVSNSSQSSAKKQQTISNFFTKHATTPTAKKASVNIKDVVDQDEHEEDPVLPARKRARYSDEGAELGGRETPDLANGEISTNHLTSITANEIRTPSAASKRTFKYAFSSSPAFDDENMEDEESVIRQKKKLHEKFVKKLGRPDSMAEIKRRNWLISEETEELAEEGEEDQSGEESARPAKAPSKGTAGKKNASKLTPMEKQFLEIKRKHLDTILIVEVGYKFKFFGEDARAAAKELSIVCIPGKFRYDEHPSEAHLDRFASASVPVHRLHVHVKRLVGAGHKVGVVRQLETAALKAAGDNRNAPFVRKLTNLYTKGTYIDDIEGLDAPTSAPSGGAPATGYLVCITESNAKGWGTDEKVHVGLVAVQPGTGDVVYDDFEDGFMRSEIETRLLHIAPCEILIVGDLSRATEKIIQHLSGSKTNVFGDKVRVERADKSKTMAVEAFNHVSNFYADRVKSLSENGNVRAGNMLDKVMQLAETVTICLSAMITHLSDYGLEHVFDLTKYFQSFSARSHMLLNGTSLTSLEIFQNQTDRSDKGSLFWTMDRTKTRFGQRLLRKWVGRPLLVKAELEERIKAVEELKDGETSQSVDKLKRLLGQIKSDLEKSLIRIYYGKCTRSELLVVLHTMQKIANEFASVKHPADAGFQSTILNQAFASLPTIAESVVNFLERINSEAAKENDKYAFFREENESDDITNHKLGIASVEQELDAHRSVAAEKLRLKKKKVEYVVVAGIEYLIEVENTQLKQVPASWAKISGTKKVSRFHTPEVIKLMRERDQHKEALAAACDTAFLNLLAEIATEYQSYRDCIQSLATLDCLLSLATVANQPGYTKPEYTDHTEISVQGGRHPMVEQLLLDTYVPNDTSLSSPQGIRALLVTGPNMGGKSSYVRQVALLSIMGQIGSYIPADSARLGMLDAVFTRMGAFDNMMQGESTFMVELSETADILKQATARSLVILDELGRGTSTHDGVAIAHAVLDHIVRETKALTLFITHYQSLASLAQGFPDGELKNVHMQFHHHRPGIENGQEGADEITFLYQVGEGVAHRSYGLNVARLANVPDAVIEVAKVKSREMEMEGKRRKVGYLMKMLGSPVEEAKGNTIDMDGLLEGIEEL